MGLNYIKQLISSEDMTSQTSNHIGNLCCYSHSILLPTFSKKILTFLLVIRFCTNFFCLVSLIFLLLYMAFNACSNEWPSLMSNHPLLGVDQTFYHPAHPTTILSGISPSFKCVVHKSLMRESTLSPGCWLRKGPWKRGAGGAALYIHIFNVYH